MTNSGYPFVVGFDTSELCSGLVVGGALRPEGLRQGDKDSTARSPWLQNSKESRRKAAPTIFAMPRSFLLFCGRGALTPRGLRCESGNQQGEGTLPTLANVP